MTRISGGVVFEHVTKRYNDVAAVSDVSFEVRPGQLVTLLGPSGCGKTTTLRMVAGLEPVTSGRILIGGNDVTHRAANERDVSMVFQSYALFPHMNVQDNVCYGPLAMGATKTRAREVAHAKLAMLGLAGLEQRLPSELSGGQQQRVAVARSLVLEPAVLLFDEPLSNLDAKLRRRVRQEIRELQQSLALTVIYVTHDQEEALAVSDQVIVMDRGCIAQQGAPAQLYDAPASRFLADFIGDANLVAGELIHGPEGASFSCERHQRARARQRRSRRTRDARGAAASAAAHDRWRRTAARRMPPRRLSRQPDRVRPRHAVGRPAAVRRGRRCAARARRARRRCVHAGRRDRARRRRLNFPHARRS